MSGIVGMIRWDGQQADPDLVWRMAGRIQHRGADGITRLHRDGISVAYLHLNVTPESFYEAQPLISHRGNILLADARIDNREELLDQLGLADGTEEDSIPDSRLIMAAYEKWDAECLDHLVGDFAFAIWEPATQTLFCGRDHSGVRPFFYHHMSGEYFLFASEIKALWAFDGLDKKINDRHTANYLAHWGQFNIYQHTTFYEGVNSLPPAHCLTVDQRRLEEKMYWTIDPKQYAFGSDEEYLAAFEETFLEAVRCRIRTPFGVSSFLSGGLDSSSVAAVASTFLSKEGKTLDTYYIDTQMEETSEREYVLPFLAKHPVSHREVTIEGEYYENLAEVAVVTDMPEMFSLNYKHFLPVLRGVSRAGSRVLLTGSDGDTVVGYGTDYIYEAVARGDWREAARRLGQSNDRREYVKAYGSKAGGERHSRVVSRMLLGVLPGMYGPRRAKWEFLKGALYYLRIPPRYLLDILSEKFSRQLIAPIDYAVDPKLAKQVMPFMKAGPEHHPTTNLLMNRGMLFQMMSEISEYYDIIGAHHQIQICHPFFDKRLIELCLFIPPRLKFYEGFGRGPLRAAMRDLLPEKLLQRKSKIDFTNYVNGQLDDMERSPHEFIEENKSLLDGYVVSNRPPSESADGLSAENKTEWQRLHHRILYFLQWRKAQGI